MGEQQKNAGQPLLTGIEELVHQISFDSHVARNEMGHETTGEVCALWDELREGEGQIDACTRAAGPRCLRATVFVR